jgi:hypothetical protein
MAENKLYEFAKNTFENICYAGGILVVAGCFYISQDGSQMSRDNSKFMNNLETKITEVVEYEGGRSNNQQIQTSSMIPIYSKKDTDKNENVNSYKGNSYQERKVVSEEPNNMLIHKNNLESF